MIVFDLHCAPLGHRFEGWFGSSTDFAAQQERGLVTCPTCGTSAVTKAPMAPAVGRKGNSLPAPSSPAPGQVAPPQALSNAAASLPPEAVAMLRAVAAAQAEAIKQSTWVGDRFAEDVRAMHYGEREEVLVHGRASPDDAEALREEGIMVAPLLVPFTPPDEVN